MTNQVDPEFAALLESNGVTLQRFMSELVNEQGFDAKGGWLNSLLTVEDALSTAVRLTGNESLAIELGARMRVGQLGIFGFALMSAATIRQALRLLQRYQGILASKVQWRQTNTADSVALCAVLPPGLQTIPRHNLETAFASVIAVGQQLLWPRRFGGELQLRGPDAGTGLAWQTIVGVKVRFDQPQDRLLMDREILAATIHTDNPAGNVLFTQQCEMLLRSFGPDPSLASRVRGELMAASGRFPSIAELAARLNRSERSLRRDLAAEGNSFSKLLAEVRNILAREYLRSTDLPVSEIAALLCYTEAPNFHRAFVSWNNTTPAEFRQNQTPISGDSILN